MLLQCSLHVAVTRQSDYQGAHLTRMSAMSVPGTNLTYDRLRFALSEERPFGVFTAGGNFTYTAVLGLTGTDQDIKLPVRSLH